MLGIDFAAIFGELDDGVLVADAERRIRYFNKAAEGIFGYSAAEMIGKRTSVIYASKDDFNKTGKERFSPEGQARADKYRIYYQRKNGEVFASETVGTALYDGRDRIAGFLGIVRDITDRLAIEEQAAVAARTLEDAVNAISEGFALYDADDRLAICNQQYRDIYHTSAPAMVPGTTFRDILLYGLENGEYDTDGMSIEEWLDERLLRHRSPDGSRVEQKLGDGRWLQIAERKTRDGGTAGVRADITALKTAQHDLADAYRDLEILNNSLPCLIAEYSLEGTCIFINDLGARWLGATPQELIGQRLRGLFKASEMAETEPYLTAATDGTRQHFEARIGFPDGRVRDVAIDYIPKFDERGRVDGIFALASDVSEQKNVQRTLKQLYDITSRRDIDSGQKIQQILEVGCVHFSLPLGIVSHIVGEIYTAKYTECPDGEIEAGTVFPLGQTYCVHTLKADEPLAIAHTGESELKSHPCYEAFKLETYIGAPILVDGERYGTINFTSLAVRAAAFTQTDQEIIKQFADWIGNEIARDRDIEQIHKAQADLERLASTDELTGIFNRRELFKRAGAEFEKFRRYGDLVSVLVFDIDHFKSINDSFGHAVGDQVLRRVAEVVEGELRSNDTFGRIGGEEFCIVLSKADVKAAYTIAERVRRRIWSDCTLTQHENREVTVSVGVASVRSADADVSEMIDRADRALYSAKHTGRNQSCVFVLEREARAMNLL